jgi:hypothetical protein
MVNACPVKARVTRSGSVLHKHEILIINNQMYARTDLKTSETAHRGDRERHVRANAPRAEYDREFENSNQLYAVITN